MALLTVNTQMDTRQYTLTHRTTTSAIWGTWPDGKAEYHIRMAQARERDE